MGPIKPNHIPQKRLEQIWAQVPPDYYDVGIKSNPLQKLWHTTKLQQILSLLPKNSRKILDIGCSSAVLTAAIAKARPRAQVTGLDSYKRAIDFARQKHPHLQFVVADAHKLPFKKQSFDLILCTETLEHVTDPKSVLSQIKRVLKPRGHAIISMDSGSLLFRIIWYFWTKSRGRVWQNAHLHEFNAKILENLIKNAGFKIQKKKLSHFGMAVNFLVTPRQRTRVF